MTDDTRFVPAPEASEEANVPLRSVYRWAKSKAVPSRRDGDVLLVDVEAVKKRQARRSASPAPVPNDAGAPAGNGATADAMAQSPDADLFARLFDAFERGEVPADLVRTMRIRPNVALAAWNDFEKLRAIAGGAGKPTLASRLEALEEQVKNLEHGRIDGLGMYVSDVESTVRQVRTDLTKLEGRVLGPAQRVDFVCQCGARGYLGAQIACTCCGRQQTWGHHPERR